MDTDTVTDTITITGTEPADEIEFDLKDPKLYLNRELSMLDFQRRVLEEAQDETNPLLERVKFLSIVGSNMDEFFMVRVGGLKMQVEAGVVDFSIDGLTPAEQLAAVRKSAANVLAEACKYWNDVILPLLNQAGVHVLNYAELTEKQLDSVQGYFDEVVFPVLTPLALDPGHPFPYISNLSLSLAILVRDQFGQEHFARVKVPSSLPRLVPIKRSSGGLRKDGTVPHHHYFVWIEQLIIANLMALFPGMEIVEAYPFRVTRNADIVIQELEADDLLETMRETVKGRRFGSVVRISINEDMPKRIREILIRNLALNVNDIYILRNPLGLGKLFELCSIDRYDLKYTPFAPPVVSALSSIDSPDGNIFTAIRGGNILLHHPYDSFIPVIEFLRAAARDPDVLAIKQTLYRAGRNSPVVQTLLEARRDHGKQVAVLVELKARFDEESNIGWARALESEGVHVTYGLMGLKTHSKIALVVRRERTSIRRYIHLGTGNYNAITAHLYEDIGMFTCDEEIGADATDVFNYLTGYSTKIDYRKLCIAPVNLRSKLESFIRREIELGQQGLSAHLIFKMNSLVDKPMIQLLYQASQSGVKVDLLVRGICCLRPGIEGLSDNIRVVSILGRFLEHSRIYYFHNAGEEEIYMGSADLMPRNLNRRVEVVFPVEDPNMVRHIRDEILETYLSDNVKSRLMQSDGSYLRCQPKPGQPAVNSQEAFLKRRTH
ncbi:MAG: polyphosphate kinase 1 [Chloroflexi bacterium]|nr:polyphosphate kinase 1 [Chloroflexota bacterium]